LSIDQPAALRRANQFRGEPDHSVEPYDGGDSRRLYSIAIWIMETALSEMPMATNP
jgi:hypothetical protein